MHRPMAILLLLLPAGTARAEKPKIAVLQPEHTGMSEELARLVGEMLVTEVQDTGTFDVISASDIEAMLDFEQQKQLMQCDVASCFTAIGGALGVDRLLITNIGHVGSSYVINIKIVNSRTASTEGRSFERIEADGDVLLDTLPAMVAELFVTPGAETETAGREVVAESTDPGSPWLSPGPLVLFGAGVAALGVGIAFGVVADGQAADSRDPMLTQLAARDAKDAGQTSAVVSSIGYGVAGAAVLGGVLLAVLGGDDEPEVGVSPAASAGGAALSVWGTF